MRDLKHGYRRREAGLSVEPWLSGAREVVDRIVTRLPSLEPSSIANGDSTDDYYRLRRFELTLVARIDPPRLDALEPDDCSTTIRMRSATIRVRKCGRGLGTLVGVV